MSPVKPSIWRLVQKCAEELTLAGRAPFTRRDLIGCIQRHHPECNANSIDPIIQGVTDNLRGGAPGAVGKNILHSVARGQFVLASSGARHEVELAAPQVVHDAQPAQKQEVRRLKSEKSITLGRYHFLYVCKIDPAQNSDGSIAEYMPQERFRNEAGLPLNRYGAGPFCKFKIPNDLEVPGVYALLGGDVLRYIGECQQLSTRYNMGYGNISPRNCFRGGQETNCRLNNLILRAIKNGEDIDLWFHETLGYKGVELELREKLRPVWNRL